MTNEKIVAKYYKWLDDNGGEPDNGIQCVSWLSRHGFIRRPKIKSAKRPTKPKTKAGNTRLRNTRIASSLA